MAVHPEAPGRGYRWVFDYRLPADGVGRPAKGNRKEAERLLAESGMLKDGDSLPTNAPEGATNG